MDEDCDSVANLVKVKDKLGKESSRGKYSTTRFREKRLSQYITTDSETGLEACNFCQKVPQGANPSIRLHHLMEHIESVHLKIMRYQCTFCDKKYPRNSQLSTHLKLIHQVKNKTDALNVEFSGDLVEKTNEDCDGVTDPVKVEDKLGKESSRGKYFLSKSKQDRVKRLSQYITTDSDTGLEACIFCQKVPPAKHPSTRRNHLMEHIESVHLKIMRYQCKFCDKKYPRNSQLSTHLKLKHNVDSKNDPLNVPFSGNLGENTNEDFDGETDPVKMELSKLGRTKSRQDQHKRLFQYITTDSESGLKACTFCQKVPQGSNPSSRLKSLMDHIDSVHLKIMSHQCQFCDKKYPRKNQLCAHLKLKHGEEKDKKLQVPRSNYGPRNKLLPSMKNLAASNDTDTESNITEITGEHPVFGKWSNSVEENYFADIGEVKKELIDELSEASQVSDSQDRKKRLFQYITTDSGTGLEACSFCQKVYQGPQPSIRQRKLMDHIDSVHLKVRSYECPFCEKKYPAKSNLCTHLKLKHSVEKDKNVPRSDYGSRNKLFPSIKDMRASHVIVTESKNTNYQVFGKWKNKAEENYFSDIGEVKKELIDEHFENESVHEGNDY